MQEACEHEARCRRPSADSRSHLSSWDLAFEVVRFTLLAPTAPDVTLEEYLKKEGYSSAFFEEYLLVSFRKAMSS